MNKNKYSKKRPITYIQKTLSHIDVFYSQATRVHVYTDGSATDAIQDCGADLSAKRPGIRNIFSYKKIQHYDAEVKALEQGAQVEIYLEYTKSEDVVFFTDSRLVLDSLAGHG